MNIILYHQDGCPQCKMIEMMLNKNSINYTSCKDTDIMMNLGINHTPTLSVDGQLLSGKEIINWININK